MGDSISLRYNLPGLQAEPTAGLWLDDKSHIRVPSVGEIKNFLHLDFDKPVQGNGFPDFPFNPNDPGINELERQLEVLIGLQESRAVGKYPESVKISTMKEKFLLTPLSRFLQLQPVPFGSIFDSNERKFGETFDEEVSAQVKVENVLEQQRRILDKKSVVLREGRELARMFEGETPGLYHRHALNWLLFSRADVSPPRQARIWMALDVTIYAALGAAWHYKWLEVPYSRLLRPEEFDRQRDSRLTVLYDSQFQPSGQEFPDPNNHPAPGAKPTPGTPRHPAWPSGHSTYSAAASRILEYFFSPDTLKESNDNLYKDYPAGGSTKVTEQGWIAAELRRLADNIGHARLWAGVHWVSDHIAGQKIGRAAADAVIKQLSQDCVPDFIPRDMNTADLPPTNKDIVEMAGRGGECIEDHDEIEPPFKKDGAVGKPFDRQFRSL